MTRYLYGLGHTASPQMCRWHCECENCDYDSEYLFRAQTDSSCAGEIITGILHHDPTHPNYREGVFDILQDAALEVDAEPGLQAGMHVHVGIAERSLDQCAQAFWAFLRYEPLLVHIAAGRWAQHRGGNESVRSMISYALAGRDPEEHSRPVDAIASIEENVDRGNRFRDVLRYVYEEHRCNDRHSNLNVNTGHGTFEYRLWNSSRSAWRMEMFTRLSVALVDPDVVTAMLQADLPRRTTRQAVDRFATLLLDAGHDRAAELVDRQATYLVDTAPTAPSTLTLT
jgi:hypothetical protein